MLCKSPYMMGSLPAGCGQCLPCRINHRRKWTWRQVFEALTHEQNAFVTLTYNDKNNPGTLRPRDLQLFLKRLRKALSPLKVRFYAVGEYGDISWRPHYHLSVFGLSLAEAPIVEKAWGLGFVQVAEFNSQTASYVCGYTVKKMTRKDDPRLNGRHPEFSRMSKRPGIGREAVEVIAKSLDTIHGTTDISVSGDVPSIVRYGKQKVLLDRYMLAKLREDIGFTEEGIEETKRARILAVCQEVQDLYLVAKSKGKVLNQKEAIIASNIGRIRTVEARAKIFNRRNL